MTGEVFRAYVEQMLAPELEPGDVVVMDNLAAHKVAGVDEAIRAAGASVLYLPPYSPDLNPIEQLFAKLKALLAKRPHARRRSSGRPSAPPRCLHASRMPELHRIQAMSPSNSKML